MQNKYQISISTSCRSVFTTLFCLMIICFSVEQFKDCSCPVNVISNVGSTVTVSCCDRANVDASFKLLFRPRSETLINYLYNDGKIAQSHENRLTMDTDKATLLPLFRLNNVTVDDTGLYDCVDIRYERTPPVTLITQLTVLCT